MHVMPWKSCLDGQQTSSSHPLAWFLVSSREIRQQSKLYLARMYVTVIDGLWVHAKHYFLVLFLKTTLHRVSRNPLFKEKHTNFLVMLSHARLEIYGSRNEYTYFLSLSMFMCLYDLFIHFFSQFK